MKFERQLSDCGIIIIHKLGQVYYQKYKHKINSPLNRSIKR